MNTPCKRMQQGQSPSSHQPELQHSRLLGLLCPERTALREVCPDAVQPKTLPEPLSVRYLSALFPTGPRDLSLPRSGLWSFS